MVPFKTASLVDLCTELPHCKSNAPRIGHKISSKQDAMASIDVISENPRQLTTSND